MERITKGAKHVWNTYAFLPGRAWDFLPQADEFDPAALRIFAMIPPKAEDARLTDVDERELDAIFKVVAAM